MSNSLGTVLMLLLIAACAYVIIRWGRRYWKVRVDRWAESQSLRVLGFRGAAFHEGPGRMLRSENQQCLRVRACDRSGRQQVVWLVFGRNWNPFSPPDEPIDIVWED
jgi:hypothetical protein